MKKTLVVVLAAMLLFSAAVIANPVLKISGVIALRNEEASGNSHLTSSKNCPKPSSLSPIPGWVTKHMWE
jgi:hypothetical protein